MRIVHDETFYSSGTVTIDGNTGVIATPITLDSVTVAKRHGQFVIVPMWFGVVGSAMGGAETNDVKIDWYMDSAGANAIGTTTFTQMTVGDPTPAVEVWPGDVTLWDVANRTTPPWIPLPAYCKITHDVGGGGESMSYIISMTYLIM